MGNISIECSSSQLESILADLAEANIVAETAYGRLHHGKTELKISYNDHDDGIVAGIVKYRLRNETRK